MAFPTVARDENSGRAVTKDAIVDKNDYLRNVKEFFGGDTQAYLSMFDIIFRCPERGFFRKRREHLFMPRNGLYFHHNKQDAENDPQKERCPVCKAKYECVAYTEETLEGETAHVHLNLKRRFRSPKEVKIVLRPKIKSLPRQQ